MGLLFVVGVMNLVWVAVIAAFVLIEKLVPKEKRPPRVGGVALWPRAAISRSPRNAASGLCRRRAAGAARDLHCYRRRKSDNEQE